jgi:hypothetical protein
MSGPSTLPIPELSQNDSPFWILQFPAVLIAYKLFSLLAEKPLTISSPFFCEFVDLVMNNLPVGPVATSSTPTLAEEFSTIRPGRTHQDCRWRHRGKRLSPPADVHCLHRLCRGPKT